jgi:hypothetical protein
MYAFLHYDLKIPLTGNTKGTRWCGKSTKHHRNPIVLVCQRQLNYRNLNTSIYQSKLSIPSSHSPHLQRKRFRQTPPSQFCSSLPVYKPILLTFLDFASHPCIAPRPRKSVKTAQYNAPAHLLHRPMYHADACMLAHRVDVAVALAMYSLLSMGVGRVRKWCTRIWMLGRRESFGVRVRVSL